MTLAKVQGGDAFNADRDLKGEILGFPNAIEKTELSEIAYSINRSVREAEKAAKSAVVFAIDAGSKLNVAKSRVPHGQWAKWLEENVEVSLRTARAYMQLASELPLLEDGKRQHVADLPLREAMKAIATQPSIPDRTPRPTVRVRALDDRAKFKKAFDAAASGIRKVSRASAAGVSIRKKEIESTRKVLEQALAQLNELERNHLDIDESETTAESPKQRTDALT